MPPTPQGPIAEPAPRLLHRAGWLLGLLTLLAVVAVAVHLGDIARIAQLLRSLSPAWLLLALLLQAATYFSLAAAWRTGLHHAGVERSVRDLLPLTLAKLFIDQAAPTGGISGTTFLVAALVRRGVAAPACLAVLLVHLVGHYSANLLAAPLAIGVLWRAHQTRSWMVGVSALFAVVSVVIPASMLALRRYGRRLPRWLLRIPGLAPVLRAVDDAPMTLLRRPRLLATMTALSTGVILLDAATLWVMLGALGLPASYAIAFSSYLLALMVTTVGPIPLGLGTFEATCVAVLVLQGIPIEGALTATLLLRGCTTWLPLLPGLILVRRELRLVPAHEGAA